MAGSALDLSTFAPQARLVNVDSGQEMASTTTSDMVSVQVTQVNTGVAQLSITVNNQRDRGDPPQPSPPTSPFYPPWKYNDLRYFKPGQRIRVDFRYAGRAGTTEAAWATLIVARITGVSFGFRTSGATLALQGEDLLSLLKNSDANDKNYRDKSEEEIFSDVVTRSGCNLDVIATKPDGVSTPLRSLMHQKRTPYLQFVQGLADRLDYEIWVDDSDMQSGGVSTGTGMVIHFEPARSLTDPGTPDLTLRWGAGDPTDSVNIVDLTAKLQASDQYDRVNAGGSNPNNQGPVQALVDSAEIKKDLHPSSAIDASAVRAQFYLSQPGETQAPMSVDTSNLDAARARLKAAAELRKKARELMVLDGSAVGSTRLRAGMHVNVAGLRAPVDGIYYVTKAIHTLDSSGYKTQFTLRRPGLTDPAQYLQEGT